MPLPWVSSEFDDCQIVSASIPAPKNKSKATTKRPLSALSQECNENYAPKQKNGGRDVPWSMKYVPKTVDDLIVAKAKITELTELLSNKAEPRIILLMGPPGCGKSTVVRCVAKSLGVKIQEWAQPTTETRSFVDSKGDFGDHFAQGVCRSFADFLLTSAPFQSLSIFSSESSEMGSMTLIEEMPMFKSDLTPETMFHDILRQCANSLRHPVCFVLTSNAASADPPELHRLFPQRLRDELGIYCLTLNPIITRSMTKALTTIATTEKVVQALSPHCIAEIVERSEGDLRSAINSLQFLSQKMLHREPESTKKRGPKERRLAPSSKSSSSRKSPTEKETKKSQSGFNLGRFMQSDSDGKSNDSHALLLFRAIGRALYCKRTPDESSSENKPSLISSDPVIKAPLPPHLKQFEADPLTFDPVALLRHCPVAPSTYVGFLQHNVPSFYSSIDDLANLSERYLSVCDLVLNQWDSSIESNSELAGLLAIYAVVNCNSSRRRFVDTEKVGGDDNQSQQTIASSSQSHRGFGAKPMNSHSQSFRPLHAPPVWNTRRFAAERQKEAKRLLPEHLAACSDQVAADYISFARSSRFASSSAALANRNWLKDLGSLGEMGRLPRSAPIATTASEFVETDQVTTIGNNQPHQSTVAPPNGQDDVDVRQQNDLFFQSLKEDDD